MQTLSKMIAEFSRFWARLGMNQRVTLVISLLLVVGLSIGLFAWSNRPDYVLLFSNLSAEDAWSVVDTLNKEGVPYKFSQNGSAIHVPADNVYGLRISLAASGLPRASEPGYEIFDGKSNFGVSDFVQQVNYQRALEGELGRTISELSGVERARVHLTMPKEALFGENPQATASIVLSLRDGRRLGEKEIAGITHLVASSVPNLSADEVTVVDRRGRILTNPIEADESIGLSQGELDIKRRLEDYLSGKVQSLLEGVLGSGRAIVKVNTELDFRRVEETKESYDPQNVVVRSEERLEEQGDQSGPENAERSITNYEINRSVQRILGGAGTIQRLSVAVFVDGKTTTATDAEGGTAATYTARSQEELDMLTSLVKTSVGFDEKRGDQVEVANLQFERDALVAAAGTAADVTGGAWKGTVMRGLNVATPFLILIAVLLFLKRSLKAIAEAFAEKKEEIEETLLPEREMDEAEARKIEVRTRVENLAVERPAEMAALIRNWMTEE